MDDPVTMNPVEQECIILFAVVDMIDDMVNYAMFERLVTTRDTNVMFLGAAEKRLFNILLVDFLSAPASRDSSMPFDLPPIPARGLTDRSYLFYLKHVCAHPKLGSNATEMSHAVETFAVWLEDRQPIDRMWLGEVGVESNLLASRYEFLKISGNIGKHNFSRLDSDIRRLARIYEANGTPLTKAQAVVALPSIYEWLHLNYFAYHASTIAEFLNQLRWSIHRYLEPEWKRSYIRDADPNSPNYQYSYPVGCNEEVARSMYWCLMNKVRQRPYLPEFTVTKHLKQQY
jgi:hypothetical protein